MFDPVPWFVGGGAQHSPEIARTLAYAAFGGAEGVIAPADLKVTPTTTPGASVRVAPGACSILNRSGASEAYVGRMISEDVVGIGATGGASRSDLIVARIEDPFAPGTPWDDPANPAVGPYIFTRVIAGVPAGTRDVAGLNLGYSAIPLARIDLPANTATVGAGNIVDLRQMPKRRTDRVLRTVTGGATQDITTAAPGFQDINAITSSIAIPTWATKVYARVNIGAAALATANVYGRLRLTMGSLVTPETGYDLNYTGSVSRHDFLIAATFDVPASMRGTTQTLRVQGNRGSGTGVLRWDYVTTAAIDLDFREDVV